MKLNKKGFTLVELLGVITILALLIAFVVPNVMDALNKGKDKTYDILKKNMKIAAENYVNECALGSTLYKVEIPSSNTTINNIVTKYTSVNSKLTAEMLCKTNSIKSCTGSTTVVANKQIIIPFVCAKVNNGTLLTALELAHNGFLKSTKDETGNRTIIRSSDDKDVSKCLKVTINYDASTYKYTYVVKDSEC